MTERTMAEVFGEALGRRTTRQIGALPVVYPILETLRLREIVNGLRHTGDSHPVCGQQSCA